MQIARAPKNFVLPRKKRLNKHIENLKPKLFKLGQLWLQLGWDRFREDFSGELKALKHKRILNADIHACNRSHDCFSHELHPFIKLLIISTKLVELYIDQQFVVCFNNHQYTLFGKFTDFPKEPIDARKKIFYEFLFLLLIEIAQFYKRDLREAFKSYFEKNLIRTRWKLTFELRLLTRILLFTWKFIHDIKEGHDKLFRNDFPAYSIWVTNKAILDGGLWLKLTVSDIVIEANYLFQKLKHQSTKLFLRFSEEKFVGITHGRI